MREAVPARPDISIGRNEEDVLHEVRRSFLLAGRTLRNVCGDFSGWHRDRPYFALWALDVDVEPVRARIAAAQCHLDNWLLHGYRRQAHITLSLCGFPWFEGDPDYPDVYRPVQLRRQFGALREAFARKSVGPFEVEIGMLASFTSAPFLAVSDATGTIAVLRRVLAETEAGHRDGPYVPHVTVGLYSGEWVSELVCTRLDQFNVDKRPVRCLVERVSLTCYASRDIGGELWRVLDVDLRNGDVRQGFSEGVWSPFLEGASVCL